MNSLPVIVRELRVEARHTMNYWLRVLGATLMLVAAGLVMINLRGGIAGKGNEMFTVLQPTLFSLILVLVPIMTCDCISRERREGTLGLLFLTPLRPVDVGLAKALSAVLRASTLILAVMPILAIPLLLGGISGKDLLRAALMDGMALVGAIAAGLMASSRCRAFSRAALLALLFSGTALLILGNVQVLYFLQQLFSGKVGPAPDEPMPAWVFIFLTTIGPWMLSSGAGGLWQQTPSLTTAPVLWVCFSQFVLSIVLLIATLALLNRNLRTLSVETGMSQRQIWWWKTFCTPKLFKRTFSRISRGLLNRNPIGWLQRRTWSARLSTWGWLAVLIVTESFLVTTSNQSFGGNWNSLMNAQPIFAAFLGIGITFSAADSFRNERETGALELLLVTPLSVRQILAGRLFGLWGQYLPVLVLLLGAWGYTSSWQLWQNAVDLSGIRFAFGLIFVSSFLALPFIGLYESLRRKHFFTAWLSTLARGLVIPIFGPGIVGLAWHWSFFQVTGVRFYSPAGDVTLLRLMIAAALIQGSFALRAAHKFQQNLNERQFATTM
ncbi:ABC transporter permease subunit [bacterium]|nr:ABC transporter permease subunit [bacterium]